MVLGEMEDASVARDLHVHGRVGVEPMLPVDVEAEEAYDATRLQIP